MMITNLGSLWTVAAVVFGFQAAAWRINREVYMEKQGEPTWLTIADGMIYISVFFLVGGVFILPIFDAVNLSIVVWMFGLALIIFALSPIVLAGHYNLYRPRKERCRLHLTTQEKWAFLVALLIIFVYLITSGLRLQGNRILTTHMFGNG